MLWVGSVNGGKGGSSMEVLCTEVEYVEYVRDMEYGIP